MGARAVISILLATAAASAVIASPAVSTAGSDGVSSDRDAILAGYNAAIERALAIDSLRVTQEMIEPQDDGTSRGATAVLVYSDGEMRREEVRSTLRYPAGDYTLASLVGPFILDGEYDVELRGREMVEGQASYRLELTAIVRDSDHFDGTVWVADDGSGPVRIVGEVADPPFPALEIRLDKSFEPGPGGYRLLRRHTGEVRVSLLLGSKWGLRHIFYEGYLLGAE